MSTIVNTQKLYLYNKDEDSWNFQVTIPKGAPLFASSVAEMEQTNRVYVNTTNHHLYYYDESTSAWVDSGESYNITVEQTTGANTESVMSQKAVTDELDAIKEDLDDTFLAINEEKILSTNSMTAWNGFYIKSDGTTGNRNANSGYNFVCERNAWYKLEFINPYQSSASYEIGCTSAKAVFLSTTYSKHVESTSGEPIWFKTDSDSNRISFCVPTAELTNVRITMYTNRIDRAESNIGVLDNAIGGYAEFGATHFRQGVWESGTGYRNIGTRICFTEYPQIKKGANIHIKANGQYVSYQILEQPTSTTFLKNVSFTSSDIDYVSEYDGYLNVNVRFSDEVRIVPNDLVAEIVVDQSRFIDLDDKIEVLSDKIEQTDANVAQLESDVNRLYTEPVFNVRTSATVNVICDCQDITKWTNPIGQPTTVDTTNFIFGTQSIHITSLGSQGNQVVIPETDFTDKILTIKIKVNSIVSSGAAGTSPTIRVLLSDSSSMTNYVVKTVYKKVQSDVFPVGVWGDVTLTIPESEQVDISKIKYIRFTTAYCDSADFNIQLIGVRPRGIQKPCISFTFDDGWSEVIDGAKILGKYGISATAYVFPHNDTSGQHLTIEQMLSLKDYYNWDIECHTSEVMSGKTEEEMVETVQTVQNFIRTNNLGDGSHYAYAGGKNDKLLADVVRRFCKSARTISQETSPFETIPSPMKYHLRAVSSIGESGAKVASVKGYIDQAVANNGWLILVFHRIGDTQTSMFCSAADLDEIAQYAVDSGADILTVADMWERN